MPSSMNFNTRVDSCNHHHNQNSPITPQTPSCCSFIVMLRTYLWSVFRHFNFVIYRMSYQWRTLIGLFNSPQYLWESLKLLQVLPFYFWPVSIVWMFRSLSIHSPIKGRFSCFQFGQLWEELPWAFACKFCVHVSFLFSRVNIQEWDFWVVW